jgi:hypothetical protein
MKCPVCGCEYFYVKNPDNPLKYYQFTYVIRGRCFLSQLNIL